MFFAYIHCKPDGVPFYVGKGNTRRVREVRRSNKMHCDVCNKYGLKSILVGAIECSSEKIAFELERGLIKCLRRSGIKLANTTDGGEGTSGWKAPESYRRNKQIAMTGDKNPFYGRTHSEDLRNKESFRAKEQWKNPELLRAASERGKAKIGTLNPFYGRQHTEASKRKNSLAHLGKPGRVYSDEERQIASLRVAGENHPFFGKHLSEEHRKKLSEISRARAVGSRFMFDTEQRRRKVLKDKITERIAQGWIFVDGSAQ